MAINLDVHGNTQPLEAAVQSAVNRIRRQPIKITVDDKGATQPLGNMKRAADEFSKSMEAANARIIAFGASMAIINGMADAFKGMVRNMVEVEKSLADINVVMGLSTQKLDAFSDGLFKVAKETGAAFKVAADAATEYARQGLNVEESLKRTKDALILTRLTGMDSAEAVKSLTAAMNTYGNQIKDTTQLVSKFAAVDVKFAVSAEDFADAISRTGAAAKGAGVNIDELIGLVTAAQQQTARGGKVIGNSFKTIFTRIGRTDTLNQLENLGIAVRDIEGKTLGAKKILTDLANTFDSLSEAQKAQIAQTVGGVFQINVLKAVLGDAAKQNGILANATQISAGATNEAIEKNEQLRNTMAAMATETGLAIKQVSAQIGEIMLAPGIEKVLNIVKSGAEGLSGILGDGEGTGNKFANGFLKGLGNVISGPGLVIITAVFGKLFLKAASFAKESLTSLIGVTSEAQKQKAIQTSLVGLFGRSSELSKEMLRTDISRTEKEKIILGLLRSQVAEAKMLDSVAKSSAATLYSKGFGANLTPRRGRAYGHIPNFANPEREQAARGGYAAGSIRSMDMPGEGSVIYNSAEKVKTFSGLSQPAIMPPLSSKAGKNYQQAFGSVHGFDPYAAKGFVPNFNSINISEGAMEAKYKDLENKNLANVGGFRAMAAGKTIGGKTGKKSFEKREGFQNPVIDLNTLYPQVSTLGVVLGVGAETKKPQPIQYSTPMAEVKRLDARKKLAKKMNVDLGDLNGKTLLSTLPTKAISPVSKEDLELIKKGKSDAVARNTIGDLVKDELTDFAKKIHKNIFGGLDKGQKPDFTSKNIVKHIDPGTLGNLYETSLRTALGDRVEDNKQASFDFRGDDARELSKFFGKSKTALELKYTLAAAKSGGIPKKILNYVSGYADGYIPNFANPLSDAIGREREAGVPVSQIRVGTHPALMNKGNPIGLGVTNTKDEPNGLKDVFGAKGYVPNYASSFLSDFSAGRDEYKSAAALQQELNIENKKLLKEQKELNQLKKSGKDVTKSLQNVEKQLRRNLQDQAFASKMAAESTREMGIAARAGGLTQKAINANQAFSNSTVGRGLSGFGGMGLMMGAPMVAGFLQEGRQGETGQERVQRMQGVGYATGGALMGAGTGAAMGMMFGPLGTAIGGVIGAISGLTGALDESREAIKEEAKVRSARISTSITSNQDVMNVVSQAAKMGKLKEFSDQDVKDRLSKAAPVAFKRKTTQGLIDEFKNRSGLVYKKEKDPLLAAAKASYPSFQSKQFESFNMNPKKFAMELEKAALKDEKTRLERKNFANLFRELPADQKIVSQNLLNPEDEKNKIFTGSEYANMIEGLSLGDFKKSKSDIDAKRLLLEEEANRSLSKQNEGIILQLNLQKAQLRAQKAAAMSQLEIKDRYDRQAMDLKALTSLGGEFLTERQKSEIKYREALNKASEQLALKKDSASANLRNQLLSMKDVKTENALKQALLEKQEGFAGKSDEEKKELADKIELEKELAKRSEEQLVNLYKQLNVDDAIKKKIEVIILAKENSVDLAKEEKDLAEQRAGKEQKINNLVADRLDAIKKQKEAHQDYIRTMALGDKISNETRKTAKLQRTLSDGPGYKRIQERHNIKFREKEIDLNYQIAEIRKNQLIEESKEAEKRLELTQREKSLKSGDIKLKEGETKEGVQRKLTEELTKSRDRSEQIKATNDAIIDQKTKQLSLEKRIAAEQIKHEASFSGGFTDASDKMLDDASRLDYQLGTITATHFRDGLVTAMDAAIDSSKDLGDALQGVAMGFLQAMQTAFLTSAANTVVGAMGLSSGGNVRNYSRGGAVPAMVSDGEYVMNRRAVNKYGSNFMHQINARGKAPKYNSGGSVNSLESFFSPQPQFSILPPRSFKDRMMDFFQNEKNMKLFQQEYQKAQLKNLQQPTIKKTSLAEAFGSPINSGSQMGLAKAFSAPINTGSASSLPDFPVNKNANIFAETEKSLIKQKDLEIRNARTSLEVPKIESKYNYLIDKINNPKVNPFDYATPNKWWQKGSPNYLLPDFIKNKPIDTSYKGYGFGSYGVGAVKRFSAGGPAAGSALAANFGSGKGVESGRAYQSMPMSGFFYSGQAESVAVQEDVDSMNEILREEKKRKMEALQKKMKKKALKNQLLGTALSAGLSFGINAAFEGGLFGGGGGDKMGLGADTINRMPESAFNFDAPAQYSSMTGWLGFDPFSNGGSVNKYASGGMIHGKSGIDQIPAMLSEGEYVIKANSVRQMGKPLLDKINAGKFYDGGLVGDSSSGSQESSSSSTNNINITLNLDKSGKKSEEQSQDGDDGSKDQRERMKEFTEKIKMQVLSVIVEEQKPGGLLQDTK